MTLQQQQRRPTIAIDIPTPRTSNQHSHSAYHFPSPASHTTVITNTNNPKSSKAAKSGTKRQKQQQQQQQQFQQQPFQQQQQQQQQQQYEHSSNHHPQHHAATLSRHRHHPPSSPSEERQSKSAQRGGRESSIANNMTSPARQESSPGQDFNYNTAKPNNPDHQHSKYRSPSPNHHALHSSSQYYNTSSTPSPLTLNKHRHVVLNSWDDHFRSPNTTHPSPNSNHNRHYHSDNEYNSYYPDENDVDEHKNSAIRSNQKKSKRKMKKQHSLSPSSPPPPHHHHHHHQQLQKEVDEYGKKKKKQPTHHYLKGGHESPGRVVAAEGNSYGAGGTIHHHAANYAYSSPAPNNNNTTTTTTTINNTQYYSESDLDNTTTDGGGSKKSRGLLSRASHKLKKRLLVGSSGGVGGINGGAILGGTSGKKNKKHDATAAVAANTTTTNTTATTPNNVFVVANPHRGFVPYDINSNAGGRDPSPSGSEERKQRRQQKQKQKQKMRRGRRRSGEGLPPRSDNTGTRRNGTTATGRREREEEPTRAKSRMYLEDEIIDLDSNDESENSEDDEEEGDENDTDGNDSIVDSDDESRDDDSTLSTNFSYELNDNVIVTASSHHHLPLTNQHPQQNHHRQHRQEEESEMQHDQNNTQQLHQQHHQEPSINASSDVLLSSKEEEIKALRETAEKALREKEEVQKQLEELSRKALQEHQQHHTTSNLQPKKISWGMESREATESSSFNDNNNQHKNSNISHAINSSRNNSQQLPDTKEEDEPTARSFADNKRRIHESLNFGKVLSEPSTTSLHNGGAGLEDKTLINGTTPTKEGGGHQNLHANLMQEMKSKFGTNAIGNSIGGEHQSDNVNKLPHKPYKQADWKKNEDREKSRHSHPNEESQKLLKENLELKQEIEIMKRKISHKRDDESNSNRTAVSEMKAKVLKLQEEFHKREESHRAQIQEYEEVLAMKEEELTEAMNGGISANKDMESLNEYSIQLANDLESYKKECASYRERILQKERDVAKMEQILFGERKKVLSLESENEMLLNLADEQIGQASTTEKSKQTELDAYKDQCDKYRDRVIQMERKLVTMESALESTGKIATALEKEKKLMGAKLDHLKKANGKLESNLADKEDSLRSFQAELSDLKSKWFGVEDKMTQAKNSANAKDMTINTLEMENASLLQKLELQSRSLETIQLAEAQCKQLENDLVSVKKERDELLAKQVQLNDELSGAKGTLSNSGRLQKMLNENESFISSLQSELSQTRSRYHQQFLEIRHKYSAEIDCLTDKLQSEKKARRDAETKCNELNERMLSLERASTELKHQETHQKKAQTEQLMKIMDETEELRKELSESKEEISILRQDISNKSLKHEHLIEDLASLERHKSELSDTLATLDSELLETRERTRKEIEELERCIEEKDRALMGLRIDLSGHDKKNISDIDHLQRVIAQIKLELEKATAANVEMSKKVEQSKEAMKNQANNLRRYIADFILSMKMEKTSLMSDIHMELIEEKAQIMRHAKGMVQDFVRKLENKHLDQSMNLQIALSSVRTDSFEISKDIKQCLSDEKNKVHYLEQSLAKMKRSNEDKLKILNAVCLKLAVGEEGLVDKLEDIEVERAGNKSDIATLKLDLDTLRSAYDNIEHDNDQLILKNEELTKCLMAKEKEAKDLESQLKEDRSTMRLHADEKSSLTFIIEQTKREVQSVRQQMTEIQADAQDQIEKGRGVIACLEEAMAMKEKDWEDNRLSMQDQISHLQREILKNTEDFHAHRKTQERAVESIIFAREEESHAMELQQAKLRQRVNTLKKQVAIFEDQSIQIQAEYSCLSTVLEETKYESQNMANKWKLEYEHIAVELNECNRTLISSEEELSSLRHQLREKTETIYKLNDTVMRNSQAKADELAEHYMTIEDELRNQLMRCQSEKDAMGRKLAIQNKETDNLMDGFFKEKRDLEACVESLESEYKTICLEFDRVSSEKESSNQRVEMLTSTVSKLEERIHVLEAHQKAADNLTNDLNQANLRIEVLESEINEGNLEIDLLSKNIEQSLGGRDNLLSSMERRHADEVKELMQRQETELSEAVSKLQGLEIEIDSLEHSLREARLEVSRLEEDRHRASETKSHQISTYEEQNLELQSSVIFYQRELEEAQTKLRDLANAKAEQDDQISKLKESLKHALEEDGRTLDQISTYEEQTFELQSSVTFYQRELEEAQTKLRDSANAKAEQDDQISKLRDSLKHALEEVLRLDETKRDSLEKLAKISASVSNVEEENEELKYSLQLSLSEAEQTNSTLLEELARAKHERDEQSKRALSEISSLQEELTSLERDRREERGAFQTKLANLQAKLESVEDLKMENEEALMNQIKLLEEDNAVEHLYKELLGKMKTTEMQYEEQLQALQVESDQLKNDVVFLNNENNELSHDKDDLVMRNKSLSETVHSLEEKLNSLANEKNDLEDARDDIILQNSDLTKNLSALEEELQSSAQNQEEFDRLNKEIQRLNEELASLSNERNEIARGRDDIIRQNSSLTKTMSVLEEELQLSINSQKEIDRLNEELKLLSNEKHHLTRARDDMISKNDSLTKSLSALEEELQSTLQNQISNSLCFDEASTTSSTSRESKLKLSRTIGELEATVREIKKHHANKVRFLQAELEEARKRLKKSERKVNDLSMLLEENAVVIATLHKKLTSKKRPSRHGIPSITSAPTLASEE